KRLQVSTRINAVGVAAQRLVVSPEDRVRGALGLVADAAADRIHPAAGGTAAGGIDGEAGIEPGQVPAAAQDRIVVAGRLAEAAAADRTPQGASRLVRFPAADGSVATTG